MIPKLCYYYWLCARRSNRIREEQEKQARERDLKSSTSKQSNVDVSIPTSNEKILNSTNYELPKPKDKVSNQANRSESAKDTAESQEQQERSSTFHLVEQVFENLSYHISVINHLTAVQESFFETKTFRCNSRWRICRFSQLNSIYKPLTSWRSHWNHLASSRYHQCLIWFIHEILSLVHYTVPWT